MRLSAVLALCLAVGASAAPFVASAHRPRVSNEALRLIETSPETREWMTQAQIDDLKARNVGFMDVTYHQEATSAPALFAPVEYGSPRFPNVVKGLTSQLSAERIKADLTKFSSFKNRYYKSTYGADSAKWLFEHLSAIAAPTQKFDAEGNLRPGSITVTKFEHSWSQFSVIVRIEGTSTKPDTVILGAHQDSIGSSLSPSTASGPGADDDGSGTTTQVEILRVLAQNHFIPELPVEFHFYSAEEGGLLGSQDIASQYSKTKRAVKGMLQIDMDGYVKPNTTPEIGIVTDYTDSKLNSFVRELAAAYTTTKATDTKCGYGCSDHASFNKYGYPSVFPFEARFENDSPYIHSDKDTIDRIDFGHVLEFARLGLSFAVELSYDV